MVMVRVRVRVMSVPPNVCLEREEVAYDGGGGTVAG